MKKKRTITKHHSSYKKNRKRRTKSKGKSKINKLTKKELIKRIRSLTPKRNRKKSKKKRTHRKKKRTYRKKGGSRAAGQKQGWGEYFASYNPFPSTMGPAPAEGEIEVRKKKAQKKWEEKQRVERKEAEEAAKAAKLQQETDRVIREAEERRTLREQKEKLTREEEQFAPERERRKQKEGMFKFKKKNQKIKIKVKVKNVVHLDFKQRVKERNNIKNYLNQS